MRIARLSLERYGHVSGEVLDFPPELGLHVVLGANEAGKSTALEAVADGLFGFSRKQSRRLAHPDDPRVGLTLRTRDGAEAHFVRRKSGRDKLLDGAGLPLPDSALARFLGGTSRERFIEVFGLDAARLRQAGEAIMAEHGEAGAAIVQAQTGLRGLRDTVEHLDGQARELFGDARGARVISRAATAVKENRRLVAERSLSGAEYLGRTARQAELAGQLEAISAELKALRAEQALLERVRRTAPVRGALAQAAASLAALGPIPALPPDAAMRRLDLLARQEQVARDLRRDQARAEDVAEALLRLDLDPAVLREDAAITALQADATRMAEIGRDRLKVSGQATAGLAQLEALARQLGVTERGLALRDRLPDAATRRQAGRLLTQHTAQVGEREAAAQALRRAAAIAQKTADELASLPAVADSDALRDAVEAARTEGAIDTALAEAAAQAEAAAGAAASAVARLPLWTGDLAALEASAVPLEAEAARLGAALDEAVAAVTASAQAAHQHDAQLDACRAAIAGITRAGPLPTLEAIAALRARRDLAWRLVRRRFVEGGAPPAAEDWPDEPPPTADRLPDLMERLLHEADALADRRGTEVARVRDWEARRDEEARLVAARVGLAAAEDAAQSRAAAALAAWRAAWQPAGVEPLDPPAMREWLRARESVLAASRAARNAGQKHAALSARHAWLSEMLHAVLPGVEGDFSARLRHATRRLRALDEQAGRRSSMTAALARAVEARDAAQEALDAVDRRTGPWQEGWAPVARRLGLEPAASPDAATEALALWSETEKTLGTWAALDDRLRDMRHVLDDHTAALAGLAGRLGLPVSDRLVGDLAARLQAARAAQRDHTRLQEEQEALATAVDAHARVVADAADRLASLRRRAGAADDAELEAVIGRAAQQAALTTAQHGRTAELHRLDDGKTDAELAAEAATIDIDAIPGRLAEIEMRVAALDGEARTCAAEAATLRLTVRTMEAGQDVAGPAQAIVDGLTEIEDAAHRYVRLRLAHALLRSGIDRFRRSQQGPLLAEASTLFAELTGGRYLRLEQDVGDKGEPVLVAARPDGSTCAADMLSEGTRDQLFLALRLASIALEAAAAEPLPFIADDLLVNFDDRRAAAALRLLARFGQVTQVILFTHHDHLLTLMDRQGASVHRLPREIADAA